MMKEEFEKMIGATISDQEYKAIEKVYLWHPSISAESGKAKEEVTQLYRKHGISIFKDMLETSEMMLNLNAIEQQAKQRLYDIRRRIDLVEKGDLSEERCRADMGNMFTRVQDQKEWELVIGFMESKYGTELTDRIRKEYA